MLSRSECLKCTKESYRADIDGLRALAVISVLLFHLDIAVFSGGFVGVDIFFVISGYLITSIIRTEYNKNNGFSFSAFYVRRTRRLFPALFFTLILCFVLSSLLFSPEHLERFGGALFFAGISLSNFYFWNEAGYFDVSSTLKPLLHTWSLSVEEQFYIIWPIVLVALLKMKYKYTVPVMLCLGGGVSLYLNQIFFDGSAALSGLINDSRSTIFYLAPFRVFEFSIGALVVFFIHIDSKNRTVSDVIFIFGLCLILLSVFTYTKEIPFPSYYALMPCIGASLLIYSGNKSRLGEKIMGNNVMVNIGLISYSVYLIHWPLIVFYKYYTFEELRVIEQLILAGVSFLLARFMYLYIEQPFRTPSNKAVYNSKIALSVILILVLSLHAWSDGGWRWRVKEAANLSKIYKVANHAVQNVDLKRYSKISQWVYARKVGDNNDVLIIGDSHARQYTWLANYLYEKLGIGSSIFSSTGCPSIFKTYNVYGAPEAINNESGLQLWCKKQTKLWEEYIHKNAHKYKYVILSSRWEWLFERGVYYRKAERSNLLVDKESPNFTVKSSKETFKRRLAYTLDVIKGLGLIPIVFGQVTNHENSLEGCDDFPRVFLSDSQILSRCSSVPKDIVLKRLAWTNSAIEEITLEKGVVTMFPTDYLCDNSGKYCRTHHLGAKLTNDDDHINRDGALYIAYRWSMSEQFPFR